MATQKTFIRGSFHNNIINVTGIIKVNDCFNVDMLISVQANKIMTEITEA